MEKMHLEGHEPAGLSMLRRLVTVQQDQIRHISDLSLKLVEAHFVIRDHFWGLYHKHEALVVLLEELGLLNHEKLQGCATECEGGGSGFVGVLNTSNSASAILVGAGRNTLSALCCASRSCIETLAALLVRAPCCEAASSDGQGDEKDDFQADLWRSAWQPTLAIWEAMNAALTDRDSCASSRSLAPQVLLSEAAAAHRASQADKWDPLVAAAKNVGPWPRVDGRRGAGEDLSLEALTFTSGTASPWRPLFPGAKDSMSLQNRGDRSWPLEAQLREAAVSSAKGKLPHSTVHERGFREAEAAEVAAYSSEANMYLDKVKDVLSRSRMGEAMVEAAQPTHRPHSPSVKDVLSRSRRGEAMVEALHRDPAAYHPGDDTWQSLGGEGMGLWPEEENILRCAAAIPRAEDGALWPERDERVFAGNAAAEVHVGFAGVHARDAGAEQTRSRSHDQRRRADAEMEAERGEAAARADRAPPPKHPVPVIKELLPQPSSEEAHRKRPAATEAKHHDPPAVASRDSGKQPLALPQDGDACYASLAPAGGGRGEAGAKAKNEERHLAAKHVTIAPPPPSPDGPLMPASEEEGEEAAADSTLWQALADVALKRTLLQALAKPSSEVADQPVHAPSQAVDQPAQSPGASPEEQKAPVRRPSEKAGTSPKLIADVFEVVLRQLRKRGLLSSRSLRSCARVSKAFLKQLRKLGRGSRVRDGEGAHATSASGMRRERERSRSASRRRQSPKPKSKKHESKGSKRTATPQRQQRSSGFTQMLKGREKVQQSGSRGTSNPAHAPRVTPAAADEEIRRQFREISAVNRASEISMKINNHIRTGELVQVQGLARRPDLNGVTGTVLNWIPKTGRWQVMLSTGEQVRLQRENLALMAWTQQLPKVLVFCEAASVAGLKLADFAGMAPVCFLKATCSRLRRAARSHMELAIYGGLGNKISGRRLDAFNVGSSSWKVYPPSHHAHFMGCTAILNGHLYICGGLDSYATRFVESVEPATSSWEDLPRLRHPRFGACAAAIAGRLLVLGGVCDDQVLSSMESYLPGENRWEEEPWMEHARCFFSTGVVGGKLVVFGGLREAAPQETLSQADSSRGHHDRARQVFPKPPDDGRPETTDGEDEPEPPSKEQTGHTFQETTELFSPYVRRWKDAPSMSRLRCQPADVVFRGLYIVCGGFDGKEHFRSVEAFDPDLNRWRRLACMVSPRVGATASAVEATGSVIVAGGYDSKGILRTVECLDFDRGRWESILPMTVPRMNPMISVVGDTAFICGGFNEEGASSKIEGFCIRTRARLKITNVPVQRPEFMALSLPS